MLRKSFLVFILIFLYLLPLTVQAAPNLARQEGISLYFQKEWELAKISFEEALREDPFDSLTLSYYYACYLWTDNMMIGVTRAEEDYVKNPDKIETLVSLAFSYYAMGQIDSAMLTEAKSEFKEILTIDPSVSVAHTGIGMIYNDKRMTPRAKVEFQTALEGDPEDVISLELLGIIVMLDDANPRESLVYFNKITEVCPSYPDAYFYKGSAHYKLEEYEESLANLKMALELDPLGLGKGYFATVFMGDIYMKIENYTEAVVSYEKALEFNPENISAQVKLQRAKEALENKDE